MKYDISPILQTEKLSVRGLSNLPKLHSLLGPEMGFKTRQPNSRHKYVLLIMSLKEKNLTLRTTKL